MLESESASSSASEAETSSTDSWPELMIWTCCDQESPALGCMVERSHLDAESVSPSFMADGQQGRQTWDCRAEEEEEEEYDEEEGEEEEEEEEEEEDEEDEEEDEEDGEETEKRTRLRLKS